MDDDGTYGARDLLTHLFSFYIGVAEVILREQPGDEPSFRNVVGLREARAAVATLAADDPLVQELDAWMKEEEPRAGAAPGRRRLWSNLTTAAPGSGPSTRPSRCGRSWHRSWILATSARES